MKPKILVLVGMIASGKSTYCREAAKKGMIIINDDSIVKTLHGEDYTLYQDNLRILYKSVETSIATLSLCLGRSVVVDRGVNISVKSRKRWIGLASSYDVNCEALVFPKFSPEIHAERRAKSDGRGYDYEYWLRVAQRHAFDYNQPTIAEGFDIIHIIPDKCDRLLGGLND